MTDIRCTMNGTVGHITLHRPGALNALTHDMCLRIETAIDAWRHVASLIIIDAEGEKAFCAGGDIASLGASAQRKDVAFGRRFWQDEYRLNAKLSEYPIPIVSFLNGFVMGGGVGLGCHGSHRIVCDSSKIAMPECGIGLIPDAGGSLLLANAPGYLGQYLGLTGTRMGPRDAIYAGFADTYIPNDHWPNLKLRLLKSGNVSLLDEYQTPTPKSTLAQVQPQISEHFGHEKLSDIFEALSSDYSEFAQRALKSLYRAAPLALSCCLEVLKRLDGTQDIRTALRLEYRYTARAIDQGDFGEGIRAAIIDKDNAPKWAHESYREVSFTEVRAMLADLGSDALRLEKTP